MSKAVAAVGKMVSIIESLSDDDKQKVLDAVLTLTGLSVGSGKSMPATKEQVAPNSRPSNGVSSAQPYFESKAPTNKIEELAVAARFLEQTEDLEEISREDFVRVFKAARRNFDKKNFGRDIANAKTRGLFNKGSSIGVVALSHAGQGFVDKLPERDVSRLKKRAPVKKSSRSAKK